MQKSTYGWLAGGLVLLGVLVFFKWEMARDRPQSAPATNAPAKEVAQNPEPVVSSNPPAVSNHIASSQPGTQDFFGAALDVVKKTGKRAGEILSSNSVSGAVSDKTKAANTVGSLLDLASDAERQLDQLGLERTQLTDEEEMEVGRKMDREILRQMPEASDPQALARLWTVGGPLFEQRKRKGIDYQVRIVRSSMVNAFSIAGGHIYVTTAFLQHFDTDGELAMVLGHEMAHIELKHAVRKVQYQYHSEKVVGKVAKIGQVVYGALTLPYSKDQEYEADDSGFDTCRKAGWSSESLFVLFENYEKFERSHDSERAAESGDPSDLEHRLGNYFKSHPPTDERLARLKKKASE